MFLKNIKNFEIFSKYMGKMVRAGAGAENLNKLEPKPPKNGSAPQQ
jgi:hypothetical protein